MRTVTIKATRPIRFLAVTLIATFVSLAPLQNALGVSLEERLTLLGEGRSEALYYEETRESRLLSRPVTYRGRLELNEATGHLIKWIDAPRPARLTMTDTELIAQAGNGPERRLPLSRRPELAALLTGLRALLDGDSAALNEAFLTDYLEGDADQWLLHLKPREDAITAGLELIEVRGDGARVKTIDMVTEDQGRQRMTMVPEPAHEH